MIEIIRKNILESLYDAKIIIVCLVFFVFMILAAFVYVIDYPVSQKNYSILQEQSSTRMNLERAEIIKKPNRFSFIHGQDDIYLPKSLVVLPDFVDYPMEDVSLRSFIGGFYHLDWMFIICHIFSLLIFILTFNLISGERERGTLKLIFSNSISKVSYMWGNLVGSHAVLIIVLVIGIMINLGIILVFTDIGFSTNDWAKIVLVVLITLILLSTLVFLGMLFSTIMKKSSISIIVLLFIWFFYAILVPGGSQLLAKILSPVPSFKAFETELGTARSEFYFKNQISNKDLSLIYSDINLSKTGKELRIRELQDKKKKEHIEAFREYVLRIQKIRDDYIRKLVSQSDIMNWIAKISPLALYEDAVAEVVQSGRFHQKDFYRRAEQYMKIFSNIVKKARSDMLNKAELIGGEIIDEGYSLKSIDWISYENVAIDRSNVPKFNDEYALLEGKRFPLVNISILIIYYLFFFLLCCLKMINCDVR